MLMAHFERYVALQRSLGLRFDQQERLLVAYARFASSAGDTFVTTQRIHAWSSGASSPGQARARYDTVRKFATFLKAEDDRHEVPPAGAFGRGKRQRPAPYLLKPSEIAAIMAAALALPPQETVSPLTYHHLFGLLAATGLRISEALALRRGDLTDDGLVVLRGKFDKCRLVPLHPSTRVALGRYLAARDRFGAGGDDLFVVRHGRAPTKTRVYCVFVRLARALGIRGAPGVRGPRLHDLRHSFRGPVARSLRARPRGCDAAHAGTEHLHGTCRRCRHLLVSRGNTGPAERHRRRGRAGIRGRCRITPLAPHLTAFLRDHLPRERGASPHTIASYADSFVLLLRFAAARVKREPADLQVEDLDVALVRAFLNHLESDRGNGARSRNVRFSAIRSFFRYIEYRAPACLQQAMSIRALPIKRTDTRLIDYLSRDEMKALLDAPNPHTVGGLRDRAMLHLAYAGGLRVSELLSLRLEDFPDRSLKTVRVIGKGRRERVLPLWRETQAALRAWLAVRPASQGPELFLNRDGRPMTRDGFAHRLAGHVEAAVRKVPSLAGKRVTPHVLRHSCAMHTLAATGDIRKVALRLGHASIQSTEHYLRADPAEKLAVLAAHGPPAIRAGRFRPPPDRLMAVLAAARDPSAPRH